MLQKKSTEENVVPPAIAQGEEEAHTDLLQCFPRHETHLLLSRKGRV